MEDNWYHSAYGRATAVPAYQVLVYGSAYLLLVPYLPLCRPTIVYLLTVISTKAYACPTLIQVAYGTLYPLVGRPTNPTQSLCQVPTMQDCQPYYPIPYIQSTILASTLSTTISLYLVCRPRVLLQDGGPAMVTP